MFEGDLNNQLRIWIGIGVYLVLIGSILFGILLKFITRLFPKIRLSFRRAILIEFIVFVLDWVLMLFLIFLSQLVHVQVLWQTVSGVASVFIGAVVYSKMIKDSQLGQIGFPIALKLSAWITLISILANIPLGLLESIIPVYGMGLTL